MKLKEGSWYLVEKSGRNKRVVLTYTSDSEEAYFNANAFCMKCDVTVISEMISKDSVDYSESMKAHEDLHDDKYAKVIQEEVDNECTSPILVSPGPVCTTSYDELVESKVSNLKFQPKVILTVGISNSGKSTWARQFIQDNPMVTDINRDDTRVAFFCKGDRGKYGEYRFSKSSESLVTQINLTRAEFAVSKGQGIVVSDTNLNEKTRRFWKSFAESKGLPYEEKVFDTSLKVCLSRNSKRDITLPKDVLINQYNSYRKFKGLTAYYGTAGKPKAIIFDVDNTLADMTGVRKPFEWHLVGKDKPRERICEMVRMYRDAGYVIVVMSGRDGVCYSDTAKWLISNDVPFMHLYMREPGDSRPDTVFKEESFWYNVAPMYDVKLVVDDRDCMVDHWRALGLECIQVAPGAF